MNIIVIILLLGEQIIHSKQNVYIYEHNEYKKKKNNNI